MADELSEAIRIRSLTRREAARRIGIHESLLSKIMAKKLDGVSASTAAKIASFLNPERADSRTGSPHAERAGLSRVFVAVADPFDEKLRPRLDAALNQLPSFSLDTALAGLPSTEGYDAAIFIADTGHRPTVRHPFVDVWVSIQSIIEERIPTFVLLGRLCGPQGTTAHGKIAQRAFQTFQTANVRMIYFDDEDEFVMGLADIVSQIRRTIVPRLRLEHP